MGSGVGLRDSPHGRLGSPTWFRFFRGFPALLGRGPSEPVLLLLRNWPRGLSRLDLARGVPIGLSPPMK